MANRLNPHNLFLLFLATTFLSLLPSCTISQVKLKNEPEGILVESPSEIKDIAIKWVEDVQMPPIGFKLDDALQELKAETDCSKADSPVQREYYNVGGGGTATEEFCSEWFQLQVSLRKKVSKLFGRQWKSLEDGWKEIQADEAFQSLLENEKEALKHLKPNNLTISTLTPLGTQYRYLIPWEALPPAESENLDRMLIQLGPQKSFQTFYLNKPKKYQIGKCDISLLERSLINTSSQVGSEVYFFIPTN
jgi:hypothetical protein